MTDAPERIWATPFDPEVMEGGTYCDAATRPTAPNHDAWCYVRADLCPESDTIEHLTQERDRFAERIDELVAQLADLPPKVKPLVWHECEGNYPSQKVWCFEFPQWMWIVQNEGGDFVWCEDVTPSWFPASGVRGVFATLEAAKSAAQADHTARILAALVQP